MMATVFIARLFNPVPGQRRAARQRAPRALADHVRQMLWREAEAGTDNTNVAGCQRFARADIFDDIERTPERLVSFFHFGSRLRAGSERREYRAGAAHQRRQ